MNSILSTILIATIPSLISAITTRILERRRHSKELQALQLELERIKIENSKASKEYDKIGLENIHTVIAMLKTELEDMKKRYTSYIESADKRREEYIKNVNEYLKEIEELNCIVETLSNSTCGVEDCMRRIKINYKND